MNLPDLVPSFADFNGDGKADLFLGKVNGNVEIINNETQPVAIIKPGETTTYINIKILDDDLKNPPTISVDKTLVIPNTAKVENGVIKLSDNRPQFDGVFMNNVRFK